ncbi:MAG TPA: LysE family translocator [Candidatus Limnocylindria bacterium]|nr:LysE family translocator [Candidatus Limnocylindria bacterium]
MDPQLWAFLLVATLLAVTPGTDTLLVARNVLGRGRTAGLATISGIACGCVVHAVLSAVGVSLILVRSAEAFRALKWGGAAYLVILGIQSLRGWWRADDVTPAATAEDRKRSGSRRLRSFLEGLLTNVLNPKVGLFYLAFLPQFIRPDDPVLARSLLLGGLHVGIGVVWLSLLSLSLVRLRPLVGSWLWRARLEGASGAVLIALGVRLAAERR